MSSDQGPAARALRAIDRAADLAAASGPPTSDGHYLRDIQAVMQLPDNREGADKSWLWPAYEFCRRHFAASRPA